SSSSIQSTIARPGRAASTSSRDPDRGAMRFGRSAATGGDGSLSRLRERAGVRVAPRAPLMCLTDPSPQPSPPQERGEGVDGARGDLRVSLHTDRTKQRNRREERMTINRRTMIKGALATGVASGTLQMPAVRSEAAPIRVGFLTVKSGPLA